MKYPFEAEFSEIEATPEPFVSAVFSSLASEFLTLPKGDGFVDYAAFESGYEALKRATGGFSTGRIWTLPPISGWARVHPSDGCDALRSAH